MDENATHPFPLLEPSLTLSRMPKRNIRKTLFSKLKIFVLENIIPSFGKYIGLPSKANCWIIFPKQPWVSLRDELLDHSLRQFFGKSSLEIPFTTTFHFSFLSCHALTPNFLGCPGAYEMHYAIFKPPMPIYQLCIYRQNSHTYHMLFIHDNNIKISSHGLINNSIPFQWLTHNYIFI